MIDLHLHLEDKRLLQDRVEELEDRVEDLEMRLKLSNDYVDALIGMMGANRMRDNNT